MNEGTLYIIVGHYGSGKTEISVNLARRLRAEGKDVLIGDLDILNPYFRSREKAQELEQLGIRVVSSVLGNDSLDDQPSISEEIYAFFRDDARERILDVGGNPEGIRILRGFARTRGLPRRYELLMVVNANRPSTRTVQQVLHFAKQLEQSGGAGITGLINNTHLLRETSAEDVLRGDELVREVSRQMRVPVRFTTYIEELSEELKNRPLAGRQMPLYLNMRPEWL